MKRCCCIHDKPYCDCLRGFPFCALEVGLVHVIFCCLQNLGLIQNNNLEVSMTEKYRFKPLRPDSPFDPDDAEEYRPSRPASHRWLRYLYISNTVISWTLVVLLSVVVIYDRTTGPDRFRQHKLFPSQLTYSPAQDAIEYEVKVFHKGQEDMPSQFQGPSSPELDQAWEDLYQGLSLAISALSKVYLPIAQTESRSYQKTKQGGW